MHPPLFVRLPTMPPPLTVPLPTLQPPLTVPLPPTHPPLFVPLLTMHPHFFVCASPNNAPPPPHTSTSVTRSVTLHSQVRRHIYAQRIARNSLAVIVSITVTVTHGMREKTSSGSMPPL